MFADFLTKLQSIPWDQTLQKSGFTVSHLSLHVKILQRIYERMKYNGERTEKQTIDTFEKKEPWPEKELDALKLDVWLDYYSFINELNQLFRVLKIKIPKELYSYRIKFFRNKVIEHWDEYVPDLVPISKSFIGAPDRCPLPLLRGLISFPQENTKIKDQIIDEFKKANVNTVWLSAEGFDYEVYSEFIYSNLEKINAKLIDDNMYKNYCNSKINQSLSSEDNRDCVISTYLVQSIFDLQFPLPVWNIEEYCNKLKIFLEKFLIVRMH